MYAGKPCHKILRPKAIGIIHMNMQVNKLKVIQIILNQNKLIKRTKEKKIYHYIFLRKTQK